MSADNSNNSNNNKSFDVKLWLFGIIGTVITPVLIHYLTQPPTPNSPPAPPTQAQTPNNPSPVSVGRDYIVINGNENTFAPQNHKNISVQDTSIKDEELTKPQAYERAYQATSADIVDYPPPPVVDKPKERGDFCCLNGEHLCKARVEPKEIGFFCYCDDTIEKGLICK